MGSTETAVSTSSERKVKAASAPLQILLFRLANDADVAPLEDAIVRAFQGGKDAEGYLANGADLGVPPQLFDAAPPISVKVKLDASCHTLVLVLVSQAFQAFLEKGRSDSTDPSTRGRLLAWLSECWDHVRRSKKRHRMLAIPLEESLARRFSAFKELQSLQVRPIQELGEFALRPTMLALLALHESRRVLALPLQGEPKEPDDPPYGHLRLFISHAKIDGLPLAHSLRYLIKSIKWHEAFYDADDLPEGSDWALELERGVASSLIIVLPTEVYDSRYWCQQEVIWSDRYCTPAVLVDARTALNHEASTLPFARLPIARVPDGNLMRILSMALREGLRFLLFCAFGRGNEADWDAAAVGRIARPLLCTKHACIAVCLSVAGREGGTGSQAVHPLSGPSARRRRVRSGAGPGRRTRSQGETFDASNACYLGMRRRSW